MPAYLLYFKSLGWLTAYQNFLMDGLTSFGMKNETIHDSDNCYSRLNTKKNAFKKYFW